MKVYLFNATYSHKAVVDFYISKIKEGNLIRSFVLINCAILWALKSRGNTICRRGVSLAFDKCTFQSKICGGQIIQSRTGMAINSMIWVLCEYVSGNHMIFWNNLGKMITKKLASTSRIRAPTIPYKLEIINFVFFS